MMLTSPNKWHLGKNGRDGGILLLQLLRLGLCCWLLLSCFLLSFSVTHVVASAETEHDPQSSSSASSKIVNSTASVMLRSSSSSLQHRHLDRRIEVDGDLTAIFNTMNSYQQDNQLEKQQQEQQNTYSSSSSEFKCTCRSCDASAWDTPITTGTTEQPIRTTCGSRIQFLLDYEKTIYPTEADACYRIGRYEYPDECSKCDPSICDGRIRNPERQSYCGCTSCTSSVFYETKTPDPDNPVSCGARITWLLSHNNGGAVANERDACIAVSDQFPNGVCGPDCDPRVCPKSSTPLPRPQPQPSLLGAPAPTPTIRIVRPTVLGVPVFIANPRKRNGSKPTTTPVNNEVPAPAPTSGPFDLYKDLGPNAVVVDSTKLNIAQIQGLFDDFYYRQVNDEMGTNRYVIMFVPGTYGSTTEPLYLKIGYYTEVIGLGSNPSDVTVYGKIEVYNRCFQPDPYKDGKFIPSDGTGLCFALNNFWRGLSNLSIRIISINQDSCRSRAMFWAISQASSMRRVDIQGGELSLMDYCTQPGFSSGGYISDSRAGKIFNGSQQQFIARNSDVSEWDGGIWNQVFLGVNGAPDDSSWPDPPYTTFEQTPISREKPYLYVDQQQYYVRVPSVVENTRGITWANGRLTHGTSIPITDFFIAKPSDSVDTINRNLFLGKNLLLTPGVYRIERPILVRRAFTTVLGLGLATIVPLNGVTAMFVYDRPGIVIAGITLDAGLKKSDVLLQIGPKGNVPTLGNWKRSPISLHDIYFRVGGPYIGSADTCLEINSNNVIIDHTWVWRADHGIENFNSDDGFEGDNQRWKTNIGRNGVVVNGDDVIAMGLFVEHYQEYNVLWNGQGGKVYFFQNELPYDPPTQNDWMAPDGTLGWAGYKVNDSVTSHEMYGGGVYSYNRNNPSIVTQNGFEVPNHPGVVMHKTYTRNLSGPGIIRNVVNGVGKTVDTDNKGPSYVLKYP